MGNNELEEYALDFEESFERPARKQRGIFYTPLTVVDEILAVSLLPMLRERSAEQIVRLRILDPACGSGIFLLRAFRLIMNELLSRDRSAGQFAPAILGNCLYGIDLDQGALRAARKVLMECAQEYSSRPHRDAVKLRCGNSLIETASLPRTNPCPSFSSFDWQKEFSEVIEHGGFDLIIGNPPYGLSRDSQIEPQENRLLQKLYAPFRDGKINKFLAFIAMSYGRLAPKGVLSFVVPNSWLGIRSAISLRRLLLEDGALTQIISFDRPLFPDPSVEAVIFTAQKSAAHDSIVLRKCSAPGCQEDWKRELPVSYCLKDPQCRIPLLWTAKSAEIVDQIRDRSFSLGSDRSPFIPAIALQAYAAGKGTPRQSKADVKGQIFHTPTKIDDNTFPYLEGGDIGRYRKQWSGRYLRHGVFLAEPQPLSRFRGPRVLVREILGRSPYLINAVYCEEPWLYNKSILHILPRKEIEAYSVKALAALINSKPVSFVLLLTGRKSQRKLFPKVLNDDLRDIPIPIVFDDIALSLSTLYEQRFDASSRRRIETLDEQIDQVVANAYGLNTTHVEEMTCFLLNGDNHDTDNDKHGAD